MVTPRRVWREVDLPSPVEGYVRVVRLADGELVALMVTSAALTPVRRAEVRRDLVAQLMRRNGSSE